jgi:hypothetical protein
MIRFDMTKNNQNLGNPLTRRVSVQQGLPEYDWENGIPK